MGGGYPWEEASDHSGLTESSYWSRCWAPAAVQVEARVAVIPGMWSQLENKYKNQPQGVVNMIAVNGRDITYSLLYLRMMGSIFEYDE